MPKKSTLQFKDGTSDKTYEVWLEATPSGKSYKVNFAWDDIDMSLFMTQISLDGLQKLPHDHSRASGAPFRVRQPGLERPRCFDRQL